MPNIRWWERWPDILEVQIKELDKAGIRYSIDEKVHEKGVLCLHITHIFEGQDLKLDVIFPELYPYFRFEIKGLNVSLKHHQNPFEKNLCFIGRSTINWAIDDTVADYIVNRLPRVIYAGSSDDDLTLREIEENQGEPVTAYYPYAKDYIVFSDSLWAIDSSIEGGTLKVGITPNLMLGILEVRDKAGTLLAKANEEIIHLFKKKIDGRWIRFEEAIRDSDHRNVLKKLTEKNKHLSRTYYQGIKDIFRNENIESFQIDLIGVIFPEEVAYRKTKDGWIFLLRRKIKEKRKGFMTRENEQIFFLRAGRMGREDMMGRIPELKGLNGKKVAIFGLGCLGAPSALEFAKCGIYELRVLDHDIVEPGTIVRWPLGIQSAGKKKTDLIKNFIESSYPYTKVVPVDMIIGEASYPLRESQAEAIENMIDGVDLVYDATAEFGVQYFLSTKAAEKGIPYICISTTYGAWGGLIARVIPQKTGCWTCLKYWQMEEYTRLEERIPVPNQDESGLVQPVGCADPTFTGASFDTGFIVMAGVRLAASTLSERVDGAYPGFDWDVAVINLRDQSGKAIAPEWKTYLLRKHPECPCSGSK